jgi:hypothetical protein
MLYFVILSRVWEQALDPYKGLVQLLTKETKRFEITASTGRLVVTVGLFSVRLSVWNQRCSNSIKLKRA